MVALSMFPKRWREIFPQYAVRNKPEAEFFDFFDSTISPILPRRTRISTKPVVWNTRIMEASLPTGSRSQTKIRAERLAAGICQFRDANRPAMNAETAGLNGTKGPKLGCCPIRNSMIPAIRQLIPPIPAPSNIPVSGGRTQPSLKEAPGTPMKGVNGTISANTFNAANTEILVSTRDFGVFLMSSSICFLILLPFFVGRRSYTCNHLFG